MPPSWPSSDGLVDQLRRIAGRRHVLTRASITSRYATGYRGGAGPVMAVVRPGSLVELWRVFTACIAADHIVIPQAANTGLTGGSTPCGEYDRPVVIISTLRIKGIRAILGGEQVICLAGSTLYDLEACLAPLRREPHSVIGSSCIGASVIGGVCNNSGGALVQRGPAYTEYALYAQVDVHGQVHLRNHLGVRLGRTPEEILENLDQNRFADKDVDCCAHSASAAADYADAVRAIDEPTPARFNSDPRRLFETSGSAGKVLVFAVRLDTFPMPRSTTLFYVGTNDPFEFSSLRREILTSPAPLPVSGEYIHREAFDLAARYGKDTVLAIRRLGTGRLPMLFRLKSLLDRAAASTKLFRPKLADRVLQFCSTLFPDHLPSRMRTFRDRYEHHLIVKVSDEGIEAARAILTRSSLAFFECSPAEASAAMLHRFAVAGAAVRLQAVAPEQVEDIAAIDVALRRNEQDWFERLPPQLETRLLGKFYYGHFFCHVFHQDYVLKKGSDAQAFKSEVLRLLDQRGGEYPAEHNVGHLYSAKPPLAGHYRSLDPGNRLNPGIGGMSRNREYL